MMPFFSKGAPGHPERIAVTLDEKGELEKIKTPVQLLKLDSQDKATHVPLKQLDMGFAAKQAMVKASEKLQENDKKVNIQVFKKERVSFLAITCKQTIDISPVCDA